MAQDDRGEQKLPPSTFERRAFVRYLSDRQVACRSAGPLRDGGWIAKVANISRTGVGLLMHHCFRRGSCLSVELQSQNGGFRRTVSMRVIHARAVVIGCTAGWLLGCAFTEHLTDEDLTALL
jgi:hypothetical protein